VTSVAPERHRTRPVARHAAPKPARSPAGLTVIRTVGELMITAGVIVLLYVVYELFWTGVETSQAQGDLREQLTQQWEAPAASGTPAPGSEQPAPATPVNEGEGVAIIRIPKLGESYAWVIVEGVNQSDLRLGPGHYPDSAGPGEVGNFAVAGHRTTYGAPFSGLDVLEAGDAVVVETADTYFTYRVDDSKIVLPTQVDVVLPVPEAPGETPTEALMTLTTCHPRYAATERLVVFSHLESQQPKSAGLPPALAA
jgi:sortase A